MPESVTDRPASALEYVFLLAKSQRYFFDMDAIKKKVGEPTRRQKTFRGGCYTNNTSFDNSYDYSGHEPYSDGDPSLSGRNFRNTDIFFESLTEPFGAIFADDELVGLDINPEAMKAAHFATFPRRIPEIAILAGTSEKGCCCECGKPWERVVEKTDPDRRNVKSDYPHKQTLATLKYKHDSDGPVSRTIGWQPGCKCNADTVPCVIMDPFFGSGTVGIVAHKHGRKFIGIELSEIYLKEIAIPRIQKETRQLRLFN
uniref:Putative methyltransferase n=1 Tax=viral metagenome TaxID=1070528 RepID=A0A6M3J2C0_9ZZZZ